MVKEKNEGLFAMEDKKGECDKDKLMRKWGEEGKREVKKIKKKRHTLVMDGCYGIN